jgi:hypothetical protein
VPGVELNAHFTNMRYNLICRTYASRLFGAYVQRVVKRWSRAKTQRTQREDILAEVLDPCREDRICGEKSNVWHIT